MKTTIVPLRYLFMIDAPFKKWMPARNLKDITNNIYTDDTDKIEKEKQEHESQERTDDIGKEERAQGTEIPELEHETTSLKMRCRRGKPFTPTPNKEHKNRKERREDTKEP